MSLTLKPGTRLRSAVCSTELIVVKAPAAEVDLTIGGVPPAADGGGEPSGGEPAAGYDGGTAMGKRYVDDAETIEVLCTKSGRGVPALSGGVLRVKEAKPLPASD